MERESYRAFHATKPLHKADHFFNFCVTAHSMRDYCLEYLGKVSKIEKEPYHRDWEAISSLVAVAEVANSSKHFMLRFGGSGSPRSPKTRAVRHGVGKYVSIFERQDGTMHVERVSRAEVRVELSDGSVLPLYAFTRAVLDYWKGYLHDIGITVRRSPLRNLAG